MEHQIGMSCHKMGFNPSLHTKFNITKTLNNTIKILASQIISHKLADLEIFKTFKQIPRNFSRKQVHGNGKY